MKYIGTREASRILGITKNRVMGLINRGQLTDHGVTAPSGKFHQRRLLLSEVKALNGKAEAIMQPTMGLGIRSKLADLEKRVRLLERLLS